MEVALSKWGNSVGLRVPVAVLRELEVECGQSVDIRVEQGKAIIEPIHDKEEKLMKLIAGITEENRHEEISTGQALGGEIL